MYSFELEVLFILLTSWAPIWVFWCGNYEFKDNYRDRSNACWECLSALLPMEHRVILLFYIPLYWLAIEYLTDMDKNSNLLGWLIGVYVVVTLITISVADQRRGTSKRGRYSQIDIRRGGTRGILKRRRRFSLFGNETSMGTFERKLEDDEIKRLNAKKNKLRRASIRLRKSIRGSVTPNLNEQELLTLILSRMTKIDTVLSRGSITVQEEKDIFDDEGERLLLGDLYNKEGRDLLLGNLPARYAGEPKLDF